MLSGQYFVFYFICSLLFSSDSYDLIVTLISGFIISLFVLFMETNNILFFKKGN